MCDWTVALLGVLAVILLGVLSAHAQERKIPPVGGNGGGEFVARCPPGQFLGGVELRAGLYIDAIRPLCRTPSAHVDRYRVYPQRDIHGKPTHPGSSYYDQDVTWYVSDAAATTSWYGGPGGGSIKVVCDNRVAKGIDEERVVAGLYVAAIGTVRRITLLCEGLNHPWAKGSWLRDKEFWKDMGKYDDTGASFESSGSVENFEVPPIRILGLALPEVRGSNVCPWGKEQSSAGSVFMRPTLAVGIHGRSGKYLDAVGLVCGEQQLPRPERPICDRAEQAFVLNEPNEASLRAECYRSRDIRPPVKPVGRVLGPGRSPSPPISICESALGARARNSPAAPGLEDKCRAFVSGLAVKGEAIANQDPAAVELRNQQPEGPVRRGFDIGMAAAEGQTADGPGKQAIRASLNIVELRGFNAAVSFSLARNKNLEGDRNAELAARGEAIANQDPLALELREQQTEGAARRGFDIGMAAAEGQTAPGPGKDRVRDSLPADERAGFVVAVAFSLERNKYAERAAKGAEIAAADASVAEARNATPDVFYRLGFDIATAIFGDPALGAQGNTATGPGSLGIRNNLSPAGQRGFDAAVKLHLSRKY